MIAIRVLAANTYVKLRCGMLRHEEAETGVGLFMGMVQTFYELAYSCAPQTQKCITITDFPEFSPFYIQWTLKLQGTRIFSMR